MILHAGLLALWGPKGWQGCLVTGPSGAGKSDLMLRCLDQASFSLVADDRVTVWISQGRLYGAPPAPLSGLIEMRGLGIARLPSRSVAQIRLVVDCVETEDQLERMPSPATVDLAGLAMPIVRLAPLEASAPFKLRRALIGLGYPEQGA